MISKEKRKYSSSVFLARFFPVHWDEFLEEYIGEYDDDNKWENQTFLELNKVYFLTRK